MYAKNYRNSLAAASYEFAKCTESIDSAIQLSQERDLSDIEKQGLILDGEGWME